MDFFSTESVDALNDLRIAHVLYACGTKYGTTILLEHNNTIHIGDHKKDFLGNNIQLEDNGIRVDTRPKLYYNDALNCQTILIPDGTVIKILYYGVFPLL